MEKKIVRMHWNSMVPMAWTPSDRGTLTRLERRNQSYLRRLSDQDNNHVIEREKEVPLFTRAKPTCGRVSRLCLAPARRTLLWGGAVMWPLARAARSRHETHEEICDTCAAFRLFCIQTCGCVWKGLCAHVLPKHWAEWQYDQWEGKCPVSMFCLEWMGVVGVGVDSGCLRWSHHLMDAAVERPHSRWPPSRAARLIRPLLMQSSGGTYRKYWSYFDRVFAPLHNQQCTAAAALIQHAQRTRRHHQMPLQKGFPLISNPKQAACASALRCLPNDFN